jgi:TRAP-type C4-dicarboxylate transport system substrate-binding protein
MRATLVLAAVLSLGARAAAQPTLLRVATVAPDGTEWARLARHFAADVAETTEHAVQVKWYFGGIAGDEEAQLQRIQRRQLDGAALTVGCDDLAPSMRVTHVLGLIQTRDEAEHILSRLRPRLDEEFRKNGFAPLTVVAFGPTILFSRQPVTSMAELRAHPFWAWDAEHVIAAQLRALGANILPLPIEKAARAYDQGTIDGFFGIPTAALAFQWAAPRSHYFLDLHMSYLAGCLVVASNEFLHLTERQQQALRDAGRRLEHDFSTSSRRLDDALLGGLFEKQGLTRLVPSAPFRAEFYHDLAEARAHIGRDLVSREQLADVVQMVADYRAEHGAPAR